MLDFLYQLSSIQLGLIVSALGLINFVFEYFEEKRRIFRVVVRTVSLMIAVFSVWTSFASRLESERTEKESLAAKNVILGLENENQKLLLEIRDVRNELSTEKKTVKKMAATVLVIINGTWTEDTKPFDPILIVIPTLETRILTFEKRDGKSPPIELFEFTHHMVYELIPGRTFAAIMQVSPRPNSPVFSRDPRKFLLSFDLLHVTIPVTGWGFRNKQNLQVDNLNIDIEINANTKIHISKKLGTWYALHPSLYGKSDRDSNFLEFRIPLEKTDLQIKD